MTLPSSRGPSWARFALINLIALGLMAVWYWRGNLPQPVVDVLPGEDRLQCVSYAPYYRPGESPLDPGFQVSRERLDADLARLAQITRCVRLYSVDQGLAAVPELAAKHGLQVLVGAWIGRDSKKNDAELSVAIALANAHRDVVRGLIVGNEVLLRREQTEEGLRAYIERAQQDTEVPVTYADVWEFWLKHKDLSSAVDFATIHILPYWEDEPRAIDAALPHVSRVMDDMSAALGKPLLIGETGWPSLGKQRDGARPGLVEQARYIREFLNAAHDRGWQYNVIEAFDQPWKRWLEGTVGGYWGMLDSDARPKFALQGPVAERADGDRPMTTAAAGLFIAALLAWIARPGRSGAVASFALSGALAGMILPAQFEFLVVSSRGIGDWLALGSVALAGWLAWIALPFAIAGRARGLLHGALRVLLFGVATAGLLLAVDGRYRDFPFLLFLMPVVQFGVAMRFAGFRLTPHPPEATVFAAIAIVGSVIAWLMDWRNIQAFAWAAMASAFAAAFLSRRP